MSQKNYFLKKFAPFVVLTIGGFYGLLEFRKLNYQFAKGKATVYREDLEKFGIKGDDYQYKTTTSIEEEYEKMMKKIDSDNWENIRGPRPWEDKSEFNEKMKKKKEERLKKLRNETKKE